LDDLLSIGVNVFVLKTLYTKVVRFSYYQGGQGAKDSSEMLKNHKELKVWPKSYELWLDFY